MRRKLADVREQVVRAAHRAYSIGLQTGNGGNLSARVPGEKIVVIKPSGSSFGECTAESLVAVDLEGQVIGDSGKPLHTYHARDKIGSIPILSVEGHADQQVVKAVKELLVKYPELKAFVQRRHGIFTFAENIALAEHHAELVEETAQIAWLVANKNG